MQESPTGQDAAAANAAADAAAAAADAAAEADARANPTPPSQEPDVVELQPGPALTAEELEVRLVRLARTIRQPDDTEAAQVARTLDLPLQPSNHSDITGLQGVLGAGTYSIKVKTLYRESPGKHVSVQVEPTEGADCPLRFDRLSAALAAATNYKSSKGPRFLDPYYTFSGALTPELEIFIHLSTESHDAPKCVSLVTFGLQQS